MHYQRGRGLVRSMDYNGAIEEYEKALEVNPRNSAAHFELGWLCQEKLKDYAAAIYHYRKHLALQTNSPTRDQARDQIRVCKGELAKEEYSPPDVQYLRKELERLNSENMVYRQRLNSMSTQLLASVEAKEAALNDAKEARAAQAVAEASAQAAAQAAARSSSQPSGQPIQPPDRDYPKPPPPSGNQPPPVNRSASRFTNVVAIEGRPKTHVIKGGDTLASISQQYNVKLSALIAANPKINPKRLKAGQIINLP